jgi:hypothetical protein
MNWLDYHFGSFGYMADCYMPMGSDIRLNNQQSNSQSDTQDKNQEKEQPESAQPQQPKKSKKDYEKTKKLGAISYDKLGNIERNFTYSEFLDYVDVPPQKDASSHEPGDQKYEDVLDFFLRRTEDIPPFDNIDMDDDEYIENKLVDHMHHGGLFDPREKERIEKEWERYYNNDKKAWLSGTLMAVSLAVVQLDMALTKWVWYRADRGIFQRHRFNQEDIAVMAQLKRLRHWWRGYRNSGTSFRFYGTENFDQAMNMARYGWTEKLDKIRKLETEIPQIYKTVPIPETKFSVAGNSVDVGRYLMGVPDCMRQTRRRISEYTDITHKYVKIVVNVAVSWTLGEDDIFNRGKNIATVINALESNNIHTKLILMNQVYKDETEEQKKSKCQSSDAPRYTTFIILKDYKDNFYLEKLMFPLAHRSFLRRLVFASKERESEAIRQKFGFHKDGGYGIPGDIFDDSDENTLYFNAGQYEQDKVNEKLAKILKSHDAQFMQRLNTNKLER